MTATEILSSALSDRYTIERMIGEGGMATVYLARDLRHNRRVALKVLRPDLGAVLGVDRFLAEIQVTANLQHPNLLPLFDSGQADGLLFYVMPFVEGESLRAKLDREKQLPVEDAVRMATAVANALDYAHAHGVIHRDLKPENILLQHGQPVVADFGIALAVSNAGGTRITQTGLSLGTPQYMSPEQATGDRVIDARTDVYSLAAVTYEMLTGEPPHTGTTAQAIIARLMTTEPQPVRVLRPTVPPHVGMAVERGLAKLPADRFGSAKAFAEALSNTAFTTSAVPTPAPHATRQPKALVATLGAFSVFALVAAGLAWVRPEAPRPVLRYQLALDSSASLVRTGRYGRIALSPDGSLLAYIGGPQNGVMLRRRDQLEATMLPGTEGSGGPVFSPDGKHIAFTQNARTLMVVAIGGGPPFAVTDSLVGLAGLSWAGNDTLIADGLGGTPLVRVAARVGAIPQFLPALDSSMDETDQLYPEVLPNGKILYTMQRSRVPHAVAVLDPRSGERRILVENARRPRYADGHLFYATDDGTLMAVGFDPDSRSVSGTPTVVATGLPNAMLAVDLTVSQSGTLAYVTTPDGSIQRELIWVDRNGNVTIADTTWHAPFSDPAISPDGTQLAVSDGSNIAAGEAFTNVWIKPLTSDGRLRVSVDGDRNSLPVWTRDGTRLLYVSSRPNKHSIVEWSTDGSAEATERVTTTQLIGPLTATPDGEWIVYQLGTGNGSRLYAHRRGDTSSTRVLDEEVRQVSPSLSPDGRFLAFSSTDGRLSTLYVSPFPNPGNVKWLVSSGSANSAVWANSGKELFYRDGVTGTIMAIPVNTNGAFSLGPPARLFPYPGTSRFAVSHDDTRFLMVRPLGATMVSQNRLIMVENWIDGLRPAANR